jgi:hypothetical protein
VSVSFARSSAKSTPQAMQSVTLTIDLPAHAAAQPAAAQLSVCRKQNEKMEWASEALPQFFPLRDQRQREHGRETTEIAEAAESEFQKQQLKRSAISASSAVKDRIYRV